MSWIDSEFPRTATPTSLVGRVLGLNPGMMTGPGTNTYLIGRRDPILLDTGAGVPDYPSAAPLHEQQWHDLVRKFLDGARAAAAWGQTPERLALEAEPDRGNSEHRIRVRS